MFRGLDFDDMIDKFYSNGNHVLQVKECNILAVTVITDIFDAPIAIDWGTFKEYSLMNATRWLEIR
jgi:hypothetical protein